MLLRGSLIVGQNTIDNSATGHNNSMTENLSKTDSLEIRKTTEESGQLMGSDGNSNDKKNKGEAENESKRSAVKGDSSTPQSGQKYQEALILNNRTIEGNKKHDDNASLPMKEVDDTNTILTEDLDQAHAVKNNDKNIVGKDGVTENVLKPSSPDLSSIVNSTIDSNESALVLIGGVKEDGKKENISSKDLSLIDHESGESSTHIIHDSNDDDEASDKEVNTSLKIDDYHDHSPSDGNHNDAAVVTTQNISKTSSSSFMANDIDNSGEDHVSSGSDDNDSGNGVISNEEKKNNNTATDAAIVVREDEEPEEKPSKNTQSDSGEKFSNEESEQSLSQMDDDNDDDMQAPEAASLSKVEKDDAVADNNSDKVDGEVAASSSNFLAKASNSVSHVISGEGSDLSVIQVEKGKEEVSKGLQTDIVQNMTVHESGAYVAPIPHEDDENDEGLPVKKSPSSENDESNTSTHNNDNTYDNSGVVTEDIPKALPPDFVSSSEIGSNDAVREDLTNNESGKSSKPLDEDYEMHTSKFPTQSGNEDDAPAGNYDNDDNIGSDESENTSKDRSFSSASKADNAIEKENATISSVFTEGVDEKKEESKSKSMHPDVGKEMNVQGAILGANETSLLPHKEKGVIKESSLQVEDQVANNTGVESKNAAYENVLTEALRNETIQENKTSASIDQINLVSSPTLEDKSSHPPKVSNSETISNESNISIKDELLFSPTRQPDPVDELKCKDQADYYYFRKLNKLNSTENLTFDENTQSNNGFNDVEGETAHKLSMENAKLNETSTEKTDYVMNCSDIARNHPEICSEVIFMEIKNDSNVFIIDSKPRQSFYSDSMKESIDNSAMVINTTSQSLVPSTNTSIDEDGYDKLGSNTMLQMEDNLNEQIGDSEIVTSTVKGGSQQKQDSSNFPLNQSQTFLTETESFVSFPEILLDTNVSITKIVTNVGSLHCPESCNAIAQCEVLWDHFPAVFHRTHNNGSKVKVNSHDIDKVEDHKEKNSIDEAKMHSETLTNNMTHIQNEDASIGYSNSSRDKDSMYSSSSLCEDDHTFLYKSHEGFNCEYIAAYKKEKCKKDHNGQKIGIYFCPRSCNMVEECEVIMKNAGAIENYTSGNVQSNINDHVLEPSEVPNMKNGSDNIQDELKADEDNQSAGMSNMMDIYDNCKDDPNFLYKGVAGFDCNYIRTSKPEKCHKFVGGQKIGTYFCPMSCNMTNECNFNVQNLSVNLGEESMMTTNVEVHSKNNVSSEVMIINPEENNSGSVISTEDIIERGRGNENLGINKTTHIDDTCKDDPNFLYKELKGYDCEYIKLNKLEKCLKDFNGKHVGLISCPEACGMVEDCIKMHQGSSEEFIDSKHKDAASLGYAEGDQDVTEESLNSFDTFTAGNVTEETVATLDRDSISNLDSHQAIDTFEVSHENQYAEELKQEFNDEFGSDEAFKQQLQQKIGSDTEVSTVDSKAELGVRTHDNYEKITSNNYDAILTPESISDLEVSLTDPSPFYSNDDPQSNEIMHRDDDAYLYNSGEGEEEYVDDPQGIVDTNGYGDESTWSSNQLDYSKGLYLDNNDWNGSQNLHVLPYEIDTSENSENPMSGNVEKWNSNNEVYQHEHSIAAFEENLEDDEGDFPVGLILVCLVLLIMFVCSRKNRQDSRASLGTYQRVDPVDRSMYVNKRS